MKIEKTPIPKTLKSFIFYFLSKQKTLFITLTICHLAWALDQVATPYIFKLFLDIIINFDGDKSLIWQEIGLIIFAGAILWILIEVMFRFYDYLATKTYPTLEANIRIQMIDYIKNHSINYFSGNFAGSISNKINDMAKSVSFLSATTIVTFIPTLIALIIGISIFVTFHPLFSFITLFWAFSNLAISLFYATKCDNFAHIQSKSNSKLIGAVVDSFSNVNAMKLFARKKYELKYLQNFQEDEKEKHQDLLFLFFKIRLIQGILCFLIMGIINIYFLVNKWQNNIITSSELVYIFYTSWGLMAMT